jgi:hypothetical protein
VEIENGLGKVTAIYKRSELVTFRVGCLIKNFKGPRRNKGRDKKLV